MFPDFRFWNTAGNTVSIWVLSTVPQLLLALVPAHVLNHARLRFALFFRMAVQVPYTPTATKMPPEVVPGGFDWFDWFDYESTDVAPHPR